jgi:hypothetical protein
MQDTNKTIAPMSGTLSITSGAFADGEHIPPVYTCDGDNMSPPLAIAGVPDGAQSLVLIMDDPDVPTAVRPDGMFVHWVLFNIPPDTAIIPAGESVGVAGLNTRGDNAYTGACPPPQYEPTQHRYMFKLYALDTTLDLSEGATKEDVESAMGEHVMAEAQLMGLYDRSDSAE